jgi:heptose I phosphotransferase
MAPAAEERWTMLDAGRLLVSDEFLPALRAAGLVTLRALMSLAGGKPYRVVPGRSTVRVELPDPAGGTRAVYVKRYTAVPWREKVRRTLRFGPAKSQADRELRAIYRLADAGIASMRAAAMGDELAAGGRREQSCLVTEEVPGATQADDLCEDAFGRDRSRQATAAKRRLIRAIAGLARRMHAANLSHRDFYLCHILVRPVPGDEPRLHLIDLARVAHHKRGLGERWIVKDLAAMLFSSWPSAATGIRSPVFTRTDAMRFVLEYFGAPRLSAHEKRIVGRVVRKARRIARREARRRASKGGGP